MTVIHEEEYEDSQLAVSQLISGNATQARLRSKQAELLQNKSQLVPNSIEKSSPDSIQRLPEAVLSGGTTEGIGIYGSGGSFDGGRGLTLSDGPHTRL